MWMLVQAVAKIEAPRPGGRRIEVWFVWFGVCLVLLVCQFWCRRAPTYNIVYHIAESQQVLAGGPSLFVLYPI